MIASLNDRTYAEGPTNFSWSSGYRHEPLAETNDKLKFVGHLRQFLRKSYKEEVHCMSEAVGD